MKPNAIQERERKGSRLVEIFAAIVFATLLVLSLIYRACYFWFLKGIDAFEKHTPDGSYPIGTSWDDHADALDVSHSMADPTCEAPATCTKGCS